MNAYARSADAYLAQRVLGTSPEQQAALLMEAGQKFLGMAIMAMERKDHLETARCLSRVTEIIVQADLRLNHAEGGELVENLKKIYDWWTQDILKASSMKDTAKLASVSRHMGEIRQAWEQLHEKQTRSVQTSEFLLTNRVV
jgi:flagellar biosynthetic protein FliS